MAILIDQASRADRLSAKTPVITLLEDIQMSRPFVFGSLSVLGLTALALSPIEGRAAARPTVIDLTQTTCQFVEIEGGDHDFTSTGAADCEAINASSGAERLAQSETLRLKPGHYVFRVKNENVPYELGF